MGGIFGKNKRPCLFPRVVYRAKGRRAARVCCDAATWTGDTYFYSARIGRAPRGSQPSAARLVMETSGSECSGEEGDSAASPRAQHSQITSLLVAAGDTRQAELSLEPAAKPHPEETKHQELPGEAQRSQIPQESSEAGAVPRPPGSSLSPELRCGDQGVTPLTQTTVVVDVHMSAGDHEEQGQGQDAAKSELLRGEEQEAGAGSGAEEEAGAGSGAEEEAGAGRGPEQEFGAGSTAEDTCVGKALGEVPLQKEGDATAASCPPEEPEVPLKAAEAGEAVTDGHGAAQEQGGEGTKAPPALQLGQGDIPVPEGAKGAAGEAEQGEEMAEACGDGQTAEEIPARLPETQEEEEEKIRISSEEKPEEH